MPGIAIVISTRNRPQLLEEALASAVAQTLPATEIIIADDASDPPVRDAALQERYGPACKVVANSSARGLAFTRQRGVEASTCDYVTHLDDDDLLAPNALEQAIQALSREPRPDLIFLGAEGFGERAAHFNRVQPEAILRVAELAGAAKSKDDVYAFDQRLFPALLRTVPIAFQRVLLTRETWNRVSALRWRAYRLEEGVTDDEAAKLRITGPLRDSEWALYAAACCRRSLLIDRPLYLQRCDGQGYSSLPGNQQLHARQGLTIKTQLMRAAAALPELASWRRETRASLATSHFDTAYRLFQSGERGSALPHLFQAIRLQPRLTHFRFLARMALPPRPSE